MHTHPARFHAALLLIALLTTTACVAPVPAATTPSSSAAAPAQTVRVALLPITDVVPFYVAQQQDLFTAQGVTAEAVPVNSGAERETVVQSGQADCELTDIHGVVLTNVTDAKQLRIIATARQATNDQPLFFLLGAPNGKVADAGQLAGANIGISENTIIDYWNDRILAALDIDGDSVTRTNVPQLPVRMELLMAGQVDAAILPDPLASLAQLQGAPLLADDTLRPDIAVSVLACREDFIAAQPDAVTAFLAGWDAAVAAINADPDAFRNILIETARVPEPLQDSYRLPPFPAPQIPTAAQVQDVVDWAVTKGLIHMGLTYTDVVDTSFRQ